MLDAAISLGPWFIGMLVAGWGIYFLIGRQILAREELVYGNSQTLRVIKRGKLLKISLPTTRVYCPKEGVFQVALNFAWAVSNIVKVDGGYIGVWHRGDSFFVVFKQPGPSQAVGLVVDKRTNTQVVTNAARVVRDESNQAPKEIQDLIEV